MRVGHQVKPAGERDIGGDVLNPAGRTPTPAIIFCSDIQNASALGQHGIQVIRELPCGEIR
jgi:hypothetical protein